MNKRIYTLALTPIIFIACANEAKQTEVIQQPAVVTSQKVDIVAPKTVTTTTKSQASVTFIENKKILEKGMMHINTFMGSLKPTLKGLLQQDKTNVTAMGACSSMAQSMTREYNQQISGVKVRRTALRYRNPKNKPDRTDRMVMDEFVAKNSFKPLVVDIGDQYRVYKPLKVKQSCILCHGARNDMNKEVVKMIDRNYPKDKATGFEIGEFRGVVVADMKK